MLREPVKLSHCEPISAGSHRSVYECPGQPHLLIKVLHRPRALPTGVYRRWLKRQVRRWWPQTHYRFLGREYRAYIQAQVAHNTAQPPISHLRGLVQTDLGLGMLTEKVIFDGHQAGPTLEDLYRCGAVSEYIAQLNVFVRQMYACDVRATDLSPANIVLGKGGRQDEINFVLVDGLGDPALLPMRSLLRSLNKRSLDKRFATLAQICGLEWQARQRVFVLPPKQTMPKPATSVQCSHQRSKSPHWVVE